MINIVVLCVLLFGSVISDPNDKIGSLPGLPTPATFDQYAGYITVDDTAGRALFYWFCESQNKPSTDPVVLWLTGGPGCSSLDALLSENGPFFPNPDGMTLSYNPYSWNRIANVIWLESPAGVGFSYSNTTSDYNVGDVRTANDTYNFLIQFFKKFPQFQGREFWVTGESYGGHYVPEAVQRIIAGNRDGKNAPINVKGFMAGNPWTYMPIDNLGAVNTWWTRALIPETAANDIISKCNLSDVGPLITNNLAWSSSVDCDTAIYYAMNIFSGVDIYDIYVDVCLSDQKLKYLQQLARYGSKFHEFLLPKNKKKRALDPCIDDHVSDYLNQNNVQAAINAKPTKWMMCSNVVDYYYSDIQKSVIPIYQDFIMNHPGLNILVYSGDVDAIVPYWGTRTWVVGLNRPIVEPWRAWYGSDQQVGGFVEVYDRFTFSTVRNAGHMVPWYQPERAWVLYSNFLKNGKLP